MTVPTHLKPEAAETARGVAARLANKHAYADQAAHEAFLEGAAWTDVPVLDGKDLVPQEAEDSDPKVFHAVHQGARAFSLNDYYLVPKRVVVEIVEE